MFIPGVIGKLILKKYGFNIPKGVMVAGLKEVKEISKEFFFPLLIHPYQPYLFCENEAVKYKAFNHQEAIELCRYLFQKSTDKEVVSRIYIEEEMKASLGYRLQINFNVVGNPVISVYQKNEKNPRVKWELDYLKGFSLEDAVELWEVVGESQEHIPALSVFSEQIYQLFSSLRLVKMEILGFAIFQDEVIVKAVNLYADDQMIKNENQLANLLGDIPIHLPRPFRTTAEKKVAEINHSERTRGWCKLIELPSQPNGVAVCFAGTGLSLTIMDFLYEQGMIPVNMTDISSGVSERKLVILLRSILQLPDVRCLIMVINIFQFSRVDVYASALVTVLDELSIDPTIFPVIVRLAGPGSKGAQEILKSMPGIRYFEEDIPFHEIQNLSRYLNNGYEGKEAL